MDSEAYNVLFEAAPTSVILAAAQHPTDDLIATNSDRHLPYVFRDAIMQKSAESLENFSGGLSVDSQGLQDSQAEKTQLLQGNIDLKPEPRFLFNHISNNNMSNEEDFHREDEEEESRNEEAKKLCEALSLQHPDFLENGQASNNLPSFNLEKDSPSPRGSVVALTDLPLPEEPIRATIDRDDEQSSPRGIKETHDDNMISDSMLLQSTGGAEIGPSLQGNGVEFPELDPIFSMHLEAPENPNYLQYRERVSTTEEGLDFGDGGASFAFADDNAENIFSGGDAVISEGDEVRESDESLNIADGDRFSHERRVDIESLPVMKNPLQKAGRHTVIRGRLRIDHPYAIAARNLGYKLVSREHEGDVGSRDEESAREYFLSDLNAFLNEIGNKHFKIPVIGGGDLDIFMLIKEVMRLGGVHNVVRKRAFRIVAQQLGIPKTCTSAASVLKGAYEKLLFHYEQRLVHGKWPEDPKKAVNMKARVCEEKLKEKRAKNASNSRSKRKLEELVENGGRPFPKREASAREMTHVIVAAEPAVKDGILRQKAAQRLLSLVTCPGENGFQLPDWAIEYCTEEDTEALISTSHGVNVANVCTAGEAILFAMCECFSTAPIQAHGGPCPDLLLAYQILHLSVSHPNRRKAQGALFNLLALTTSSPDSPRLAANRSADALIDGLVFVLGEFFNAYLDSSNGNTQERIWAVESRVPFGRGGLRETKLDIAAAYCALRVLSEICSEGGNRERMFDGRGDVLEMLDRYLGYQGLHRTFLLGILDTIYNATLTVCGGGGQREGDGQVWKSIVEGLVNVLGKCMRGRKGMKEGDFEVSEKVLKSVSLYCAEWRLQWDVLGRYLEMLCRVLGEENLVSGVECVAEAACNVTVLHGEVAGENKEFVTGVIRLVKRGSEGQIAELGVEALRLMFGGSGGARGGEWMRELKRACEEGCIKRGNLGMVRDLIEEIGDGDGDGDEDGDGDGAGDDDDDDDDDDDGVDLELVE